MALDRFITLSEAAQRMRTSVKETRSMIKSGKIKGGLLPDGAMVVSEDTIPKRKEDLPEYKKHEYLRGVGIGINEAAKKYSLNFSTLRRWSQSGYIARLGSEKNKILIIEQDVAYCLLCGSSREDQPDARVHEVLKYQSYLPIDLAQVVEVLADKICPHLNAIPF